MFNLKMFNLSALDASYINLFLDIIRIGEKKPYFQLEIVQEEHVIIAIAGTINMNATSSTAILSCSLHCQFVEYADALLL